MKRIILAAALLSFSLGVQAEGFFHLVKKNGSANGFNKIDQLTDAKGNTEMTCNEPGAMPAEFVKAPNSNDNTDYNKIIHYVDDAITAGKSSGKTTVEGRMVQWKGSDAYNYELTVAALKK
ncbi:hypothetical protein [Taibaiella koreensis]|uniref:hypothetical protein n=1 Tax=Taibaiella koreensis TaxID=1268548 RepID=UPI000E59ED33|nr:hypothetical protein [Taibaiella koreensis]